MGRQTQRHAPGPVQQAVSPSAPGLPPESGVAVDLRQVVPDGTAATPLLVILGAGATLAFVALTASVLLDASAVASADLDVHSWVLANRSEPTIAVARWLTWGGATIIALPALVVVGTLASPSRRALRSRIGSGVLLAGIASIGIYLGLLINRAVGGARPLEGDWAGTAGGPTFPSGHTTAATIGATFVVWALLPRMRTTRQRAVLVTAAAACGGVVGLTRVWLGVHWPSDVVGGWLYGLAWAALAAVTVLAVRRRWPRLGIRSVNGCP